MKTNNLGHRKEKNEKQGGMDTMHKQFVSTKTQTSGITLIALVVTIIVLLILAGVAISMLSGDNGILNRATQAKEQTAIKGTIEEIQLAVTAAQMYGLGDIDYDTLNSELDKIGYTGADITRLPVAVDIKDGSYVISSNGNVIKGKWYYDENGNVTDGKGTTLEIGKYVNYEEQISETREIEGKTIYTSESSKNGYEKQVFKLSSYTYGWRVLGLDEDTGEILLVAEDFVCPSIGGYTDSSTGRTYYRLKGREGYANALDELQNICSLYKQGKYATGARSITVEDVDRITGYNPENTDGNGAKYGKGHINEYGNKVTYYWDGTEKPYYKATNKLSGNLSFSHNNSRYGCGFFWYDESEKTWKSSLYADSTGASSENKKKITTLESNYYKYSGASYISNTSEGYKMLFYNTATGANPGSAGSASGFYYWLGSRYINTIKNGANFGVRNVASGGLGEPKLAFSFGATGDNYYGVRPVVSLSSEVDINMTGKDGTSSSPYEIK